MSSVFKKSDPKDPSIRRWVAKIKVGDEWKNVALRIVAAAGTKRLAEARAGELQTECLAGRISDRTARWLGPTSTARLSALVGRSSAKILEGGVTGWRSALDAYLASTNARDTRTVVQGKAKAEEKTKISRKYKLKVFADWAQANGLPFMREPFTETIRSYIEHRKSIGIAASTLWSGEFNLLCRWGNWMASRNLCEPIDRERVREVMPFRPPPEIRVPTWQSDLETLRFLHGKRLADGSTGSDWKRKRNYFPAWSLVLVVRGLGCRPSEATALSWDTVDLEKGQVRFLASKNHRSRLVPILFRWVQDGLAEAWERAGRPRSGPVCRKWDGGVWKFDSSAANMLQGLFESGGRPVYHLKKAQKLYIAHMIRVGFPPHAVAYWTDHSLSVQEKHYFQGDGYLPPEDGWDYAEFGTLSSYGQKVRNHTGPAESIP